MKLGEKFPPEDRLAFVRQSLVPGSILYLSCSFTTPPKEKFVVLVSLDPEPVVFMINSEISRWLQDRPALRDCQVTIHQQDHLFLSYDSYIDCTQAVRKFTAQDLERQLVQDLGKIKGKITLHEREAVLYSVQNCRTLESKLKSFIIAALKTDPV